MIDASVAASPPRSNSYVKKKALNRRTHIAQAHSCSSAGKIRQRKRYIRNVSKKSSKGKPAEPLATRIISIN